MILNQCNIYLIVLLCTVTITKTEFWEHKKGPMVDKILDVQEGTETPYPIYQFKASDLAVKTFRVTGETDNKIEIDNDGWLYLQHALDWEEKQSHSLTIEALDETSETVEGPISVTIIVKDVNDNRPIFNQSEYNGVVREHSLAGEPFMKVFATDLDDPSTSHGKLRFSILNQIPDRLKVPLFQIDQLTGDISTTPEGTEALKARTPFMIHQEEEEDSLQSLMRKFDAYCIPRQNVTYDMNPFFTCVQRKGGLRVDPQIDADYTLIIAVKDLEGLSENALSGSTKVNIVVKQNLWVAPKPLSIPENWPEVHPFQITQVQWNEPGAVYVLAQKERYPKFPFTIDIEGRIFLTEHLDREEEDMYVLVVFVRDEYNNDLDRPLEIHITVEDENDNAPVCEEKETVFEVQENEKIGNEIGNLKVTDLDEENTENSLLSYQIKSQEPKHPFPSMFSIDENLGKIQIENAHFQKREFPQYNLTVKVSDKGGKASGLITECKIVIKIIDINNQIPIFQKSQYEPITKSEDTAVGTTLLSLQATDNDDPGTGSSKIVYTVGEGDPEGVFAINTNEETNEGYLYIVKPLDFEAQSLHRLRIDARNPEPLVSGVNYNSSSSTFVTINVTDVNEAPVFDSVIYQETVLEDLAVGTVILNVHANDPEHTKISYRLEDDIFNWLEVNPDTGDISSKASLDREKTDVYNVRVIAREKEIPYQETEVQVTIYLNDINDNIPKLTMQNPEAVFCYPLGEPKVILLEATDPDLSPFGAPLTFSIDDKYSLDWKIEQINGTFAKLVMQHKNFQEKSHKVDIKIKDHGNLENSQPFSVGICTCSKNGDCYFEPDTQNDKPSITLTAGVLGGTFACIALILMTVYCRIKKRNPENTTKQPNGSAEINPMLE